MLSIASATATDLVSLPASLYSNCGKLSVEIKSLSDDRAMVVCDKQPISGSFAYLVRNGIKLPAQIAWGQGNRLGLSLEGAPLEGRRSEKFRQES